MEVILKIPSAQSTFNATNNILDIVLPGNSGVYDLSQMYVVIDTAVTSDFGNATAANKLGGTLGADSAVANLRLDFRQNSVGAADPSIYANTACPIETLVRSCRMTSQSRGVVEDVRNSDSLRATMKAYTQDLDDVEAAALVGTAGSAKTSPWASGRYAKLNGVGNVLSTAQRHELRIYLRDLYEICSVEDWDTSVYGDTTFSMELNIDRLEIKQVLAAGSPWDQYYHNNSNAATLGPIVSYGEAVIMEFAIATPASLAQTSTAITMAAVYQNIEDHPFWVGQMLNIISDVAVAAGSVGTAATTNPALGPTAKKWAVVKSISWDAVTKQVTLEFGSIVLSIADISGITGAERFKVKRVIEGFPDQNQALKINSIELNAVRRTDVAAGPSTIQYSQWSAQADQFSSGSSLNRTYYLPARTTEVVIVLPSNSKYGSDILGSQRLGSYRFSINGDTVTNRAVPYMDVLPTNDANNDGKGDAGSSLHYDLVSKTFMNMGKRFHSLNECVYDQAIPINTAVPSGANGTHGWLDIVNQPQKRCFALFCPVPLSDQQSQFGLELDGVFAAGTGRVLMYSHVASTI